MGLYKHIQKIWKKPRESLGVGFRDKLVKWRRQNVTVRIKRPTRLDKARSLGYRAKQGIFMVRQRVSKGGHTKPKRAGGRRSKRASPRMTLSKNYKVIAEERTNKKYPNCEVLNSYLVIMLEKSLIKKDKKLGWISGQRGRVHRGITSAGRKMRGLRHKGKGSEKTRPSRKAHM